MRIIGVRPQLSRATSYQYDVAGRLAARKVQAGSQTDLITQRYGYDPVERLAQIKYIKAEGTGSEQLIEQLDYSYDAAGRRTSKTALNNNGMGASETPMTASYDAANRMSQISLNIAGQTQTYALTYDTNGNLTSKQNTAQQTDKTLYTWDASNRLSQIAQTGATAANSLNASFTYDAFGRRIQSSIATGNNPAQTVQYLYEGAQSLGEIRNGALTNRLLTGLSLDETIARIAISTNGQKDAANSRIYLTDALNSVIAQLSDDNANPGQLQNSYGYSPYGETITVGPDSTNNPIQYTSRENDGTGLYFYRNRYYDAVLKRFVSSDPIGLAGGTNTFEYVEGNPLSYSDPWGLQRGGGPTAKGAFGKLSPNEGRPQPKVSENNSTKAELNNLTNPPTESEILPAGVYPGVNFPWSMPKVKPYCLVCATPIPDLLPRPDNSICRATDYQYDAVGRTTEVRDQASVNTSQYDAAGRTIETLSTTAAGSHKLQYQYDSLDRVIQRTLSGTGIASPEVTTYQWDLAGRLLSHTTNIAGQAHTTSYQYDVAGRLAARKVQAGSQTDLITQRYGYDPVERLAQIKYIKAEGTGSEQLIEQLDYSYDAAGRRTSKTALNNNGMGAGETPMTATYDAANRMSQISLNIAGATKTYALTYDAVGNLTSKQNTATPADKTSYTWDASNRLSQIAQTGATAANSLNASFTYDAFGRRIQSSIATSNNPAQTVQYLYEGAQSLGEIRDGKLSHRLLTGLSLDETIARIAINSSGQKDSANSRIFMTDALNSVIAQLSDDNANPGALQNSWV